MGNNDTKYIGVQEGIYIGSIEELEYSEASAVIKLPQFAIPIIVFSPEVSMQHVGPVIYSKTDEGVGDDGFSSIFPNSALREFQPGDSGLFFFFAGAIALIADEYKKVKGVMFDEESSYTLTGKLEYVPATLENAGILPYKGVIVRGQVVEYGDDFVIDGGIPLILSKSYADEKGIKVGDWIESKPSQVSFAFKFPKAS